MIKSFLATSGRGLRRLTSLPLRMDSRYYPEDVNGSPSDNTDSAATDKPIVRGVKHVFNDSVVEIPDVYAQYRSQFQQPLPQSLTAYRKQLMYRVGHIGTKELELVMSQYLDQEAYGWTYNELLAFDRDVLKMENPTLVKYLMNGDFVEEKHRSEHLWRLLQYVEKRKIGAICPEEYNYDKFSAETERKEREQTQTRAFDK